MDTGTLVTILVVALVVVVLLFLVRAAGVGRRRPQLRALPPESRDRYIGEWDEIEMKSAQSQTGFQIAGNRILCAQPVLLNGKREGTLKLGALEPVQRTGGVRLGFIMLGAALTGAAVAMAIRRRVTLSR